MSAFTSPNSSEHAQNTDIQIYWINVPSEVEIVQ